MRPTALPSQWLLPPCPASASLSGLHYFRPKLHSWTLAAQRSVNSPRAKSAMVHQPSVETRCPQLVQPQRLASMYQQGLGDPTTKPLSGTIPVACHQACPWPAWFPTLPGCRHTGVKALPVAWSLPHKLSGTEGAATVSPSTADPTCSHLCLEVDGCLGPPTPMHHKPGERQR